MKLSQIVGCVFLMAQANAFQPVMPNTRSARTSLGMFSGAGAGAPKEDNPEEIAQMEQAAKAMGMSMEEYNLAMTARVKLAEAMDNKIVKGGKDETVLVERDVNNPPKKFEVTITEAGKELGKEAVSKELVAALKKASEEARKGRTQAQQEMMAFIAEKSK